MSLMEITIMDQKKEFILLWLSGKQSFSKLCRDFNIARTTGYHYVEKYKKWGMDGLANRSTRPHTSPTQTPQQIVDRIIQIRTTGHTKGWGGKKILWQLEQDGVYKDLPAVSTINLILRRNDLIPERKKRSRVEPRKPIFDPHEPNEVWSADFKGQFRLKNGEICYPLTICDSKTRMILAIKGLRKPDFEGTKAAFRRVFKDYGLPKQLHTDNGTPFGNIRAIGRLTRFGAWLMDLGIEPIFSDPGHPEQNGRHERMHRDLKSAACRNPSKNLQSQQVRFNSFKKNYNENRPHESLNMSTPAQVYSKSKIAYKDKIDEWLYPETYMVKYICGNGIIRVGKDGAIFVGSALKGKKVGLEPLGNEIYRLYYRDFLLGYIDWNNYKAYDINDRSYGSELYTKS